MTKIHCDVLTGFLGSGKSTLLNAFLRTEAGPHTAVIVNEFGTIGIDQFMFEELAEGVYLLDSGCLCCTVTNSLAETLLDIRQRASQAAGMRLDRVIIETTGLADPLPILHALIGDKSLTPLFRLDKVIVTVDGTQGLEQLARHTEPVRQVAVADQIVVTKCDMGDHSGIHALQHALRDINSSAPIHHSSSDAPMVEVFRQQASGHDPLRVRTGDSPQRHSSDTDEHTHDHAPDAGTGSAHTHVHSHGDTSHAVHDWAVGSWSEYIEQPVTWVGIAAWWSLLVNRFGKDLLRCKGIVRLSSSEMVMLQGVGTVFHSPERLSAWPDPKDARSRVVCIGMNLDETWLRKSLRALFLTDPASRPLSLEDLEHCQ